MTRTRVTRTFAAEHAQLASVRAFVRQRAIESSFSPVVDDLVLATNEACANSIAHTDSSKIAVSVAAEDARIEIEVRDQGVFLRRAPVPELDGEGHRGLQLIMARRAGRRFRISMPQRPGRRTSPGRSFG